LVEDGVFVVLLLFEQVGQGALEGENCPKEDYTVYQSYWELGNEIDCW
jgi:hypothetical protein